MFINMDKKALLEAAKAVLEKNRTPHFTKPAPNLYPHQWNWDAGFIAIGLAHYDMARAEAELRHLFSGQWSNGFLPHIIFREEADARYFPGPDFWQTERNPAAPSSPATSGITQPPVHGFVLWRLYEIATDKDRAKAFLKSLFPKVVALHRHLYENRDPLDEGLIYIRHPWESGTDNSPTWDAPLAKIDLSNADLPPYTRQDLQNPKAARHRPTDLDYDRYVHLVDLFRQNNYDERAIFEVCPFLVQCPLFNGILSKSNEALIKIGALLGEDIAEILQWHELTLFSLNEKLWDEEWGLYNAFDLRHNCLLPVETSSGILPLFGNVPTQDQAEQTLRLLKHPAFGGTPDNPVWRCPTYSLLADDVDFERYWRGPVWINMNWMLYHGLRAFDFNQLAEQVREDSLELLSRFGFYEYFDPRKSVTTDNGYGTPQFSWSAALCIDFLSDSFQDH